MSEPERLSRCSSCGRLIPRDPTSKYFVARPDDGPDSDWCGCSEGSGT